MIRTELGIDLNLVLLKADLNAQYDNIKYKLTIPRQQRQEAEINRQIFLGGALDYLREDTTNKLGVLQPTSSQVRSFYYLLNSVEDGTLILDKTAGFYNDIGKAGLVSSYSTK